MPQTVASTFLSEQPRELVLPAGFRFQTGQTIAPFTIVYETFGTLNSDKSNAILVCHALSAGAHCAGKYLEADERPGWWDGLVGYGKGIDLDRFFVVCVNFPGSCFGTTAPRGCERRCARTSSWHRSWPPASWPRTHRTVRRAGA